VGARIRRTANGQVSNKRPNCPNSRNPPWITRWFDRPRTNRPPTVVPPPRYPSGDIERRADTDFAPTTLKTQNGRRHWHIPRQDRTRHAPEQRRPSREAVASDRTIIRKTSSCGGRARTRLVGPHQNRVRALRLPYGTRNPSSCCAGHYGLQGRATKPLPQKRYSCRDHWFH
jgi:hypothetical protein